jgi:enterobactin synthetase component D
MATSSHEATIPPGVRDLVTLAAARSRGAILEALAIGSGEIVAHPQEELLSIDMSAPRRAQFIAGRACARRAVRRLANLESPVGRDSDGVPTWPSGLTGSITHKHSICVAAVAFTRELSCLGIDLERDEGRDEEPLAKTIVGAADTAQMARLRDLRLASPSTALLAAKEAAYKAAFPSLRRVMDWLEIEILPGEGDLFVARLGQDRGWLGAGQLGTRDGWIFALCWQPATA